jgi:hypothetical protein
MALSASAAVRLFSATAQGHNGFDKIVLQDGRALSVEHYTHYLDHKYFEVKLWRWPGAAGQAVRRRPPRF